MARSKSGELNLTEGSPFSLLIAFSIPMILGNLFQQLYNFVDTMIVGHFLGVDALAGVGATGSINFLILGFCMGMCAGFAIPVAQMYGAKDYVALRKYVANAYHLSLWCSVAITVIVALLCRQILVWMRTPAEVIDYSYVYICTIFLGIPITFIYNVLAGVIRSIGDSKSPLIFLIISTFINVGLDYLFIAGLDMGVFGAALATVIAQIISAIMCLVLIIRRYDILHVKGNEWKADTHYIGNLCKMGLPMGLQYSITGIGSVILQSSVNALGPIAVAATTAASKVNMLFICIIDALGAAMATYGGQNLGAGKIDRLRKGTLAAVIIGISYCVMAFVAVIFVRRPLITLFVDKPVPEMIDMAALQVIITIGCLSLLVFVNVLRFMIQGVGFSNFAIIAGVLEMIARTVAGVVFIPLFGFVGACVASPFAWLLADCFLVPAFFYVVNKLDKTVNGAKVESQN
ncbi:MAG: MATE family efflux transporter [Lachnospiraceae bacterium]|nr:MATE family efflux transporter [Lachnospiraceae bacterium]